VEVSHPKRRNTASENGNISPSHSIHYTSKTKNMVINVHEEYQIQEQMEAYTLSRQKSSKLSQRKAKSTWKTYKNRSKTYKSPSSQMASKASFTKRVNLDTVKKNLGLETPEMVTKEKCMFATPDAAQIPQISYKQMVKSNITSFREAVDIWKTSKLW
jgi:hypothetical protein